MGFLLLVFSHGYGKTTLMAYVTGHLGMIFMRINYPALDRPAECLPCRATMHAGGYEARK